MTKTRFAPSPTGHLHIGGARTAIISWLIAKKLKGNFLLRIEDTDTVRSKDEYTNSIMDSLQWLGIMHNEGPFFQMQRIERYKQVAEQLVKEGKAYLCYSTDTELQQQREEYKNKFGHDGWKYDRKWRDLPPPNNTDIVPVVRLKVPLDGSVVWNDLTKGEIKIQNAQLDDFIIMRSDGTPTYNFCVVVDDVDMEISHVIRGDDHINNTPKQIHIYNALNANIPTFGHIPLILNPDGKKQSKRDDDTSVNTYKNKGFLPQAIVNYLLLISCNDVGKEIFTKEEFVELFSLEKLGNTPIKFDEEKLLWINQHIKNLSTKEFIDIVKKELTINNLLIKDNFDTNYEVLENALKERSKTLNDIGPLMKPLIDFNGSAFTEDLMQKILNSVMKIHDWTAESVHEAIKNVAENENLKFGELVKPLRKNVFNEAKLPLAEMFIFLGKERISNFLKVKNVNKHTI